MTLAPIVFDLECLPIKYEPKAEDALYLSRISDVADESDAIFNLAIGAVVPMPTLPFAAIRTLSITLLILSLVPNVSANEPLPVLTPDIVPNPFPPPEPVASNSNVAATPEVVFGFEILAHCPLVRVFVSIYPVAMSFVTVNLEPGLVVPMPTLPLLSKNNKLLTVPFEKIATGPEEL